MLATKSKQGLALVAESSVSTRGEECEGLKQRQQSLTGCWACHPRDSVGHLKAVRAIFASLQP